MGVMWDMGWGEGRAGWLQNPAKPHNYREEPGDVLQALPVSRVGEV